MKARLLIIINLFAIYIVWDSSATASPKSDKIAMASIVGRGRGSDGAKKCCRPL